MQRRVKEWHRIMAKELVYAGTAELFAEPIRLPELALIGVDPSSLSEKQCSKRISSSKLTTRCIVTNIMDVLVQD